MTNLSGANLNNGAAVGPQGEGMDSPSTFPKYPAYKDSGVEWLGEVPDHWVKSSIKHVAAINMGQSPNSDDCNTDGVGLPFLQGNGEFGTKYPTPKQYCPVARKIADAGDLLFSVRAPVGALNEADQIYGIGRGLCAMKASREISKEFFWWFLSSSQSFLDSISTGSTFEAVSAEQVANIAIALPRLVEQTQIARFLDHETARIDELIEEQQRLIELLKEKRQAVISHAVTKGLDPTAPMKDSGVEWLGKVPAHWDVVRFKHIKSWRPNAFVDGPFGSNLKSEHFVDDGDVYVIESGFATTGALSFSGLKQITLEHFETIQRSEVCAGDIVIAKIGARYGMCSILPWIDKPAVVSGNSLKLTVDEEICDSRFAVFVLQHLKERGAIEDIVNMTAQPALSLGEMNNLPFPLPSLDEQLSIVSELEIQLGEFEALTSECKQVMSLAIERRSALISAAVTGKIDVRGWQPPVSTPAPESAAEAN